MIANAHCSFQGRRNIVKLNNNIYNGNNYLIYGGFKFVKGVGQWSLSIKEIKL